MINLQITPGKKVMVNEEAEDIIYLDTICTFDFEAHNLHAGRVLGMVSRLFRDCNDLELQIERLGPDELVIRCNRLISNPAVQSPTIMPNDPPAWYCKFTPMSRVLDEDFMLLMVLVVPWAHLNRHRLSPSIKLAAAA
jgi:hypothetical protein